MWATEWPSTAESDVNPQTQPRGLGGGKAQRIDVFIREIGQISETGLKVVQRLRIQGGDLHASYAGRLHLFKFPLDFGFRDRGAEPPPAHHDAAVIGRMREGLRELGRGRIGLAKARRKVQTEQKQNARYGSPWQSPRRHAGYDTPVQFEGTAVYSCANHPEK